jgi:glyoxylase-like metal-dependent hydrolase (beta-lactamase superfamily II)
MAYALGGTEMLFSGDHVMGWSTTIVAPPDGSMRGYMESLAKLRARPERTYFPGHGPAIRNAPDYVEHLRRHREAREAAIRRELAKGEADIPALVRSIYVGLDPRLTGAAGLSVLAHLEDLVGRGLAATDGEPTIAGRYRAADGTA